MRSHGVIFLALLVVCLYLSQGVVKGAERPWLSMITTMEPFRDRVNGATSGSG